MFYNVHTHRQSRGKDVLSIENRYENFDSDLSGIYVSLGLHPWYLDAGHLEAQLGILAKNARRPEVLAVGECGLDRITDTDWTLQVTAFRKQIALAQHIHKPVIVHCVKAFNEVLSELKNISVPVVFHGVNKKWSVVQPVIDAGYFLSFGKAILSDHEYILETFRATPLERVFLETDDAELDIREIYKSAARIKNIPEKEIVLQLEKNFNNVFKQ